MNLIDQVDDIKGFAYRSNYSFLTYQHDISMISFEKKEIRINIYLTTGTVGTCVNHPKRGKTQLFRKNCDLKEISKIFKNPRTHTNKGYYVKPK